MEPDLEQARRRAKERLRAERRGEITMQRGSRAAARGRERSVANGIGFPSGRRSWGTSRRRAAAGAERAARLVTRRSPGAGPGGAAARGRPGLARAGLDVALVLGDAETVAPSPPIRGSCAASSPGPGRKPLSCACHSAFLAPEQPRGRRAFAWSSCARGAGANETFDNEYGAMPVLYGAAEVAHDPETTGCCWTAARTRTTASRSTTRSRRRTPRASRSCSSAGATVRAHERARQGPQACLRARASRAGEICALQTPSCATRCCGRARTRSRSC